MDKRLLEILILAEEQVFLRTQEYPFQDQSERSHCWNTLKKIQDAIRVETTGDKDDNVK